MAKILQMLPRIVPLQTIPQTPDATLAAPQVPGMVAAQPEIMQLARAPYGGIAPVNAELNRSINGTGTATTLVQAAPGTGRGGPNTSIITSDPRYIESAKKAQDARNAAEWAKREALIKSLK